MTQKLSVKQSKLLFKKAKSYDDYCLYMDMFINNKVSFHLDQFTTYDEHNLCEFGDEIQKYLHIFNTNRFLTLCSQPSSIHLNGKIHFQYPFVKGLMKVELARSVYNELENDPNIIVIYNEKSNVKKSNTTQLYIAPSGRIGVTYQQVGELTARPVTWIDGVYKNDTFDYQISQYPNICDSKNDYTLFTVINLTFNQKQTHAFKKLGQCLIRHNKIVDSDKTMPNI